MANNSLCTFAGAGRKTAAGRFNPRRRAALAAACALVVLASCGSAAKDTLAPAGTDAETQAVGGAGPIAVAAASSEAALEAQRAESAGTLKSLTVTFTSPADSTGEMKADMPGATCPAPGKVPEGGPYELSYGSSKNAKVMAFSVKTQGTYEGPGTYSADFIWTGPSGAITGTGSIFVYTDEESGEFTVEGADPAAGTWQCTFKK